MEVSLGSGTEPGTQGETAIVFTKRVQTCMLQELTRIWTKVECCIVTGVFKIACGSRRKKVAVRRGRKMKQRKIRKAEGFQIAASS
jgi:hypothetical protein